MSEASRCELESLSSTAAWLIDGTSHRPYLGFQQTETTTNGHSVLDLSQIGWPWTGMISLIYLPACTLHSHTAAPSTMILLAKAYPSRNLPDLDQHPPINAPPHSGRPLHPLPQVTHSSCNTHSFSASLDLPLLPCLVVSHFTGARYPTHNGRPLGWPSARPIKNCLLMHQHHCILQ